MNSLIVLGVPLTIKIKEPSKKNQIISLMNEIKNISDDLGLDILINSVLKAIGADKSDSLINTQESTENKVKSYRKRTHHLDEYSDIIEMWLDDKLSIARILSKLQKDFKVYENYQNLRNFIVNKNLRKA